MKVPLPCGCFWIAITDGFVLVRIATCNEPHKEPGIKSGVKRCKRCGQDRDLATEWNWTNYKARKLDAYCKFCRREITREIRERRSDSKENNRLGVKASNAAATRLIAEHREKFEQYVDEERLKLGLKRSQAVKPRSKDG